MLRAWIAWWLLCAALWLALIDRVPIAGLLTGVVAAALGASTAVLVRLGRRTLVRPRARWLRAVGAALLALVRDLVPLASALMARGVLRRSEVGRVRALPYDPERAPGHQEAFRVLSTVLGSLGPNTIVLDVDPHERVLYAHQLVPTRDPTKGAMPLGEG